jgi:hypothetical protein
VARRVDFIHFTSVCTKQEPLSVVASLGRFLLLGVKFQTIFSNVDFFVNLLVVADIFLRKRF